MMKLLSNHALSKIHLITYDSYFKFIFILGEVINQNPGQ